MRTRSGAQFGDPVARRVRNKCNDRFYDEEVRKKVGGRAAPTPPHSSATGRSWSRPYRVTEGRERVHALPWATFRGSGPTQFDRKRSDPELRTACRRGRPNQSA